MQAKAVLFIQFTLSSSFLFIIHGRNAFKNMPVHHSLVAFTYSLYLNKTVRHNLNISNRYYKLYLFSTLAKDGITSLKLKMD